MRNVKVLIIIIIIKSFYWCAWQQLRDKSQASTGKRKYINTEAVNKQKQRWREIHKDCTSWELHNTEPEALVLFKGTEQIKRGLILEEDENYDYDYYDNNM
jgi:hypothetical protein